MILSPAEYQRRWNAVNPEKRRAQTRRYREKHRDKVRALNRKWAKAHPAVMLRAQAKYLKSAHGKARRLLIGAANRAKKLRVPFDLTMDDIQLPLELGVCEATSLPFVMTGRVRSPFAPSLDRLECPKGYVRGNVRVVIWALNAACGNWGEETLWKIVSSRWPDRVRRAA